MKTEGRLKLVDVDSNEFYHKQFAMLMVYMTSLWQMTTSNCLIILISAYPISNWLPKKLLKRSSQAWVALITYWSWLGLNIFAAQTPQKGWIMLWKITPKKLATLKCHGKTSEVCFLTYFDKLNLNLKSICARKFPIMRYQNCHVWLSTTVPSNSWRLIRATKIVGISLIVTKVKSIKQSEEPESIRVQVERECSQMDRVVKRELGLERADALS